MSVVGVLIIVALRGDVCEYSIRNGKIKFGLVLMVLSLIPFLVFGPGIESFGNTGESSIFYLDDI